MKLKPTLKTFSQRMLPVAAIAQSLRQRPRFVLIWQKKRARRSAQPPTVRTSQIVKVEQHLHSADSHFTSIQKNHFAKIQQVHSTRQSHLSIVWPSMSASYGLACSQLNQRLQRATLTTLPPKYRGESVALSSTRLARIISRQVKRDSVGMKRGNSTRNLKPLWAHAPKSRTSSQIKIELKTKHNKLPSQVAQVQSYKQTKHRAPEQLYSNPMLIEPASRRPDLDRRKSYTRAEQPIEFIYRKAAAARPNSPALFGTTTLSDEQSYHTQDQATRPAPTAKSQLREQSAATDFNRSETMTLHDQVLRNVLSTKSITDRLVDNVMQRIEQKMKIERQRRGL